MASTVVTAGRGGRHSYRDCIHNLSPVIPVLTTQMDGKRNAGILGSLSNPRSHSASLFKSLNPLNLDCCCSERA